MDTILSFEPNLRPEAPGSGTERAMVDGIVGMIAQRDRLTASHLDAVGMLAGRLAENMGLDRSGTDRVVLAARLHDVGKHSIPMRILRKPASLDAEEWRTIRLHPIFGGAIVAGFPYLAKYEFIVRSHHERVDGLGYPNGLVGEEIPLESRLIAVVDAFHAMTVSRPYTNVRTPSAALTELLACAGTQFDGAIVEEFVRMIGYRSRAIRSA